MRFSLFCLMFAALLFAGCAKPWTNEAAGEGKKADAQFEHDSVQCEASAGELSPLDRHRQLDLYEACMEDKGWVRERKGDGIPYKKKK